MADQFKLIYRLAWYKWLPINLYESFIGLFFLIIGLGGVGVELAHLFGLAQTGLKWYQDLIACAFGLLLALVAGRAIFTSLVDIIYPASNYQGKLEELQREHVGGSHGGFYVWSLRSGQQWWQIECLSAENLATLLTVAQPIRLRYRRGTRLVTHLWRG